MGQPPWMIWPNHGKSDDPRSEERPEERPVEPDRAPPPSMTHDKIIGRTVLGKYQVERKLGAGSKGTVYLIRHKELQDTTAALKVIQPSADSLDARERFHQEALVAAALGGHRVVRPIDIGRFEDGSPYIAMEYVEGRSLLEELNEAGRLPLSAALHIAERVADTMRVAHEKKIVHRDLEPTNIMLCRGEHSAQGVRVLDFGVARVEGAMKVAFTRQGTPMGKPGYMSPEAATGCDVDGRADVFSLGVVLFRMVSGVLPFPGDDKRALLDAVLNSDKAPTLASRLPPDAEVPTPRVEKLLAGALEKNLKRRLTMAELHAQLVAAVAEFDKPRSAPALSAQSPSPAPRRSPWPARALIATLLLLAATLAIVLLQKH